VPKRVFVFERFPNYFKQQTYKIALQFYQLIIMQYKEEEKEQVGVDFGDRALWAGSIIVRSADEILPPDMARRRLGLAADELVFYVGLGGGGNPQNDEAIKWVLDVLAEFPSVRTACAAQPLSKQQDLLLERDNVIAVNHYPMLEYLSAFDVAIASGGSLTTSELVYAGVPAIWTPLGFPSTDQEFNADRFAGRELGIQVKMFDTDSLKAAIEKLLDAKQRAEMAQRMRAWTGTNGAEVAARAITRLLEAPSTANAR
jgi:UDP:flavonoid glycosyltransferase YjiC (YdhE family)